jgi:hypothetical protein
VLQRFERRLGGLVEGAFARVFGGVVQPVEVAAALQREAADKRAVVGQGRVLVPNTYVVELGASDAGRLGEYDEPLRAELASMVREHADEQGWSFVGAVRVAFEEVDELATGVFRVRSAVVADAPAPARPRPGPAPVPPRPLPATARATAGPRLRPLPPGPRRPRLVLPRSAGPGREHPLVASVTVIGRGAEADLRLADTGVSRAHAEVLLDGPEVRLTDLGSTNGTLVNGRRISAAVLVDGDRIEVGATPLVFRREG